MNLLNWFTNKFFKKVISHPIIVDLEIAPNIIAISTQEPAIEETIIDKDIKKYMHTKMRIRERYGYYLSRETYDNWNKLISVGSPKIKFVESRNVGKLYMVELCMKNVFVVYHEGSIVTALPYNPIWVRIARTNYKPKGKASKHVGRGEL